MSVTIQEVRAAQPEWFSRKNMRFFGDVSYKVLHSSSHKPYLVRLTAMWSDMFGQPKTYRYRVNEIDSGAKIGKLLDQQFRDIEAVKRYLRGL